MISVLMSVYRGERPEYLAAALESIVQQSEEPDEIVLVKDGPLTAELEEVIGRYEKICGTRVNGGSESRIRFRTVRLPENQGLGSALAAGMKECSGELIARMDTDDIACRDRLRLQRAYMDAHPEISAVGGDICEFMDEAELYRSMAAAEAGRACRAAESRRQNAGEAAEASRRPYSTAGEAAEANQKMCSTAAEGAHKRRYTGLRIKRMPTGSQALYRYGKLRNPLNHMTVMMRKADVEAVGGYHRRPLLEDYDLWSRLLAAGYKIDNIPQILVYARIGAGFSSRRGGRGYFLEYARLRWMQLHIGYLHGWEYMRAMGATALMTLMPPRLRSAAYRVLRR